MLLLAINIRLSLNFSTMPALPDMYGLIVLRVPCSLVLLLIVTPRDQPCWIELGYLSTLSRMPRACL